MRINDAIKTVTNTFSRLPKELGPIALITALAISALALIALASCGIYYLLSNRVKVADVKNCATPANEIADRVDSIVCSQPLLGQSSAPLDSSIHQSANPTNSHIIRDLGLSESFSDFSVVIGSPDSEVDEWLKSRDAIKYCTDLRESHLLALFTLDEANPNSIRFIKQYLAENYGYDLANRIIHRYRLHHQGEVTCDTLKSVLIGVAASVRLNDLKRLFDEMKHGCKHDMPMQCVRYISAANQEQLVKAPSFDDLSPDQIMMLVSAFKSVEIDNEIVSPSVLFDAKAIEARAKKNFDPMKHDLDLLKDLELVHHLETHEHYDLAITEYLAKHLVYNEFSHQMLFSFPNKEGQLVHHHVADHLNPLGDGIVCLLTAPVNHCQDPENNIHLIFRGTQRDKAYEGAATSIGRDFNWNGIGRRVFEKRSRELLTMLEDFLCKQADGVTLNISGHSLGGVDVQRAITLIAGALINAPSDSPLHKIKKINAVTHNSPYGNPSLNQAFKLAIASLNDPARAIPPPNINLTHVQYSDEYSEDLVQNCGDVLVGADLEATCIKGEQRVLEKAAWLQRRIVHVKMKQRHGPIGGILRRHGTKVFNKNMYDGDKTVTYLEDSILIEKKLARNFYWDKEKTAGFNWVVGNISWYAQSAFLRKPKRLAHFLVDTIASTLTFDRKTTHEARLRKF